MDAAARRRLLYEKITANNQRRKREELLRRLPPSISHVLDECPCIYSPEIDPILRQLLPFNQSGVGSTGFKPPNYNYVEVAWDEKVFALVSCLVVPEHVGKAFLLMNGPQADVPVFVVEFRWALPLLPKLWPYCNYRVLFLVEQDLRAGILIGNHVGYLLEDWNPREIVYEVTRWPVQTTDPSH